MVNTAIHKQLPWQQTSGSVLSRQLTVTWTAAQFLGSLWWTRQVSSRSAGASAVRSGRRQAQAEWLTERLLRLGPTFIKIGQALSTRVDLLPEEYVVALSRLQDQVPQFDAQEAIAILEAELGQSVYQLYRTFDRTPIAAASLGQVHRAKLHDGTEVVVKIQRPGLKQLFDLDVKILRRLVTFCDRYLPWTRSSDLIGLHSEFAAILYQEIDYLQEALNAERFRRNFAGKPEILVPSIYSELTTAKVLTMDYMPGIKINDLQQLQACGINAKDINRIGICCYLKQLLQDGFFQADPHPGNMAVSSDGRLIFYDFGMMAEVQSVDQGEMLKTFFAMLRKDTDQVLSTLINMGLVEAACDKTALRRVLRFMLDEFLDKPVDVKGFQEVRTEIYALVQEHPFRMPAKMAFILKAVTTLDGVARDLDPSYNLITCAQPFVKDLAVADGPRSFGSLAKQSLSLLRYKFTETSRQRLKVVQALEARLEAQELQLRLQTLAQQRSAKNVALAMQGLVFCLVAASLAGLGLVSSQMGWAIAGLVAFGLAGLAGLCCLRSLFSLAFRAQVDHLAQQ
jgi:predicted unusual protein kinase regulating ubiquinone biosynthesis (AarF/ABC1/UbiB family)